MSDNYSFWSNVGIDVETAKAAAVTIDSISKADPAVVEYTGTDPANDEFVVLTVRGMFQLDKVVARVANVDAVNNTFELEGIDSTLFETFTSGTFQVVTFGASMTTVQEVNASGGEPEFADITTVHQNIRKRVPVVTSPLSFNFTCLFDPSDAAMAELAAATRAISQRCIKFRFSNGAKMVFQAYPSAPGVPTGSAQQVVQTPVTLEAQGLPTVYAD